MAPSTSWPAPSTASAATVASQHEPTIHFTTVKELYQELNSVSGDCLIVTDVSVTAFREIDYEIRERLGRKFRFHYRANSGILIINTTTAVQGALYIELYKAFRKQLFDRGIEDGWRTLGRTTFHAQDGGDIGEADQCGFPRPGRRVRDGGWPTLVVEAGHTHSLAGLRAKKDWWFSTSEGQVKIVLLVKYGHQGRSEILIENWQEELRGVRTRARLRQSITITLKRARGWESYEVHGGPLVLPFRLLFLRDPSIEEGGDITITVPEMEEFAEWVWEDVHDSEML